MSEEVIKIEDKKPKPIYRDRLIIDDTIVSMKYIHANNQVTYYCYHEEGKSTKNRPYIPEDPVKEFKASKHRYVCFSQLLNILKDGGGSINRVLYHMQVASNACIKLTLDEQRRFIELSVKHRMLPKYVTPDSLISETEGKIVIMLEDLTPSLLYMYLSQYRYLREDPGFIRSILHLYDRIGFGFYAAFVIASRVSIDYTAHHFLTLQRRYGDGDKNNVNNTTIPFSTVVGLSRFVRRPHDYDDRKLTSNKNQYEASDRIESICKIEEELKPYELLEPLIKRAVSGMTDKISKKYITQYLKMRDRITIREKKEIATNAENIDNRQ